MKKITTLLLLIGFVVTCQAQVLPNGTFETWEEFSAPTLTYFQPDFWDTPNGFTGQAGTVVVSKSSDAYYGTFSARLETKELLGGMFKAPGLITMATFNVNILTFEYTFSNGLALQEKVQNLTGMYKYSGANNDSASVIIYCYKKEGDVYDTIGAGFGFLHDATDWTPFEIEMQYLNDHQPDTFNVIIMSSGSTSLNPGSVLFVDSLSAQTNVGVIDLNAQQIKINTYPNPTTDLIMFDASFPSAERMLILYDIQGKIMDKIAFPSTQLQISLAPYPTGSILYRVIDVDNSWATGTIVKE